MPLLGRLYAYAGAFGMSRPLFSWRHAILESDLPSTTRLVLLTLSCHMSDAGDSCFPSVVRLASESGLSKKAVIEHLKIAKEKGWILVSAHGFGGQKWKRHEYVVAVPKGGNRELPRKEIEGGHPDAKGGEPHSKGGNPHVKKAVTDVHPSTSVNSTGNSTENSTGEGRASAPAPAREANATKSRADTRQKRGKRLVPADWVPDDRLIAWCAEKFPHIAVEPEVEKFRDRSRAKDERYLDFDAGFRSWMRKAHEFARRDGKAPSGGGARRYLD